MNKPVQPGLQLQSDYVEKLVSWNPRMTKGQALCYQFRTGGGASQTLLIPDACANFLFRCDEDGCELHISGIQSEKSEVALKPDATYFGFKPYCVMGMRSFGVDWRELLDETMVGAESMSCFQRISEILAKATSFEQRSSIMRDFAYRRLVDQDYIQGVVEFAEHTICSADGNVRVADVSDQTGYTAQYCRKCFRESVGVTIKNYASVLRFQNVVRSFPDSSKDLAEIVYENGYCDQSHLTKEFKRFTDMTPNAFRKRYGVVA